MKDLGYYNGRFGAVEEMTVPFNDRVHFFGDGVYDVTYTRNHIPFALDEHLDRFYRSAAMLDIRIPTAASSSSTCRQRAAHSPATTFTRRICTRISGSC